MNIATPLIPVAAAALGLAVRTVSNALENGTAFSRSLHQGQPDRADSTAHGPDAVLDTGPEQSDLARQVKHDALRQRFEAASQAVHQKLIQQFAHHGIDLTEPAVLKVDSHGRLLEAGGHWDRAKIEQLFESDPALRREVVQILHQGRMLDDSASATAENEAAGTSRLVVSERGAFFQVV